MAKTNNKEAGASKEVAVQKGGAVGQVMPDFMKQYAGQGTDSIQSSDLLVPRIALLQALSPQVAEKGERIGDFYHTVAEESLGEKLTIVPLVYTKQAILWNPRENGGGILARSTFNNKTKQFDPWNPSNAEFTVKIKGLKNPVQWATKGSVAESGLLNWGTFNPEDDKSQPAATEIHSFLVALPDHMELGPAILAFQRSAVKPARKLLSRLALNSQIPIFGQKFTVVAVDEKNKSGEGFKNYGINPAGLVDDVEQFEAFRQLHEQFKTQTFDIADVAAMQGDAPEGDDAGGTTAGKVSEKF